MHAYVRVFEPCYAHCPERYGIALITAMLSVVAPATTAAGISNEEKLEKVPNCLVFSLTPYVLLLSRDWKWTSMHVFVRVLAYLNTALLTGQKP